MEGAVLEVEFADGDLDRLEVDPTFTAGFGRDVVRGYRKAMQAIRAAADERDLYRGGLRMEKLSGDRQGQYSLRINKQWRLIIELDNGTEPKTIRILEVTDYH